MKNVFLLIVLTLYFGTILASASSNVMSKGFIINHPHDGNDYECGGDDHYITLTNYANAKNPTYARLLSFLKEDKTDEKPYTDTYVCADFAETLHNNAEKKGIKCAWVGCDFKEGGDGHAFNMFETTDKGKIFIDDTGDDGVTKYEDSIMNVKVGKFLTEKYLFKTGSIDPMGVIKSIEVYW
jgi:hypothetical protein